MDREAIRTTVKEWLSTLVADQPDFAWLECAQLTAEPAFLVDAQTKEGDDYKAGAVTVVVTMDRTPSSDEVEKLYDTVVGDRTLGNRVKRAHFERPRDERQAGTIVVIPL